MDPDLCIAWPLPEDQEPLLSRADSQAKYLTQADEMGELPKYGIR
jgi:hypothetical protein